MQKNVGLCGILLGACIVMLGCGTPTPPGMPRLVDVVITITQEGNPLAGAAVMLNDPSRTMTFIVGGFTDANGVVALRTHGQYKGAPLGTYKVQVTKDVTDEIPPAPPENTPAYAAYQKEYITKPPKTYMLVEKQYSESQTTPLEIEIKGKTTLTFDVGKTVKIAY